MNEMRKAILYYAIKYQGDWNKIGQAIRSKESFQEIKISESYVTIVDEAYPLSFRQLRFPPWIIFYRGNYDLLKKRCVGIVGARNCSQKAIENATLVSQRLKQRYCIVSGLAKGIDVAAHITALQNNFNTIAVIGTNLNQYYPLENKDVQMEIEKKGLIISQFSPATKTERWFFPLRNGVMSGISQATVIMEAGETSGALKQATFALKQKHLVLIPQNVCRTPTITWPERFIKKGAIRVNSPKDIIEELTKHKVYKVEPELEFDFSDTLNNLVVAEKETEYSAFSLK